MLVQVLNMQKSVSVLHILRTLFWPCLDISPYRTYIYARLISFLHSGSLVDPLSNKDVFISVFPSIGHLSAVNDFIQHWLIPVVEIIKCFALLGAGLDGITTRLAENSLSTLV